MYRGKLKKDLENENQQTTDKNGDTHADDKEEEDEEDEEGSAPKPVSDVSASTSSSAVASLPTGASAPIAVPAPTAATPLTAHPPEVANVEAPNSEGPSSSSGTTRRNRSSARVANQAEPRPSAPIIPQGSNGSAAVEPTRALEQNVVPAPQPPVRHRSRSPEQNAVPAPQPPIVNGMNLFSSIPTDVYILEAEPAKKVPSPGNADEETVPIQRTLPDEVKKIMNEFYDRVSGCPFSYQYQELEEKTGLTRKQVGEMCDFSA